ncbi:hypothetical protein JCM24511_08868 [Saitozyma sp. JCM 24511]|nr:hypothetical protein JCM24511_08868 [Saitozyma sp. JCM 24511]
MQSLKRKTPPAWVSSPSPSLAGPSGTRASPVKVEDGEDVKRRRADGPMKALTASHGNYMDPRTAALDLRSQLKSRGTMNWGDAFFYIQEACPGMEPGSVLEMLKGLERVRFNEANQVFEYIPELTITSTTQLASHIRLRSTPTVGLPVRPLREAIQPPQLANPWLEELETGGSVLIMRTLGPFRETALPPLGRKNADGLGINDGGPGRMKSVFWDDVREKGRAGKRVDDEFVFSWADVPIAETDDIGKLLADEELSASSAVPPAPKITPSGPVKKKKKSTRALKITNTHMKALGIDFSKDYEQLS